MIPHPYVAGWFGVGVGFSVPETHVNQPLTL